MATFKKKFLNKKAQMSAPFELFVAVIIMGFVIIIGSQMIGTANANVCINSVDKAMGEFKGHLEETVNQKSSSKFFFQPEKCFDMKKTKISIDKISNSRTCAAKCGKPYNSCFVMSFYSSDLANGYIDKCLNLPTYTSFFSSDYSATCLAVGELEGYVAIDPANGGIKLGSYVLRNVSSAGDTYPKICIFYSPTG